jgi:hypothetical protein
VSNRWASRTSNSQASHPARVLKRGVSRPPRVHRHVMTEGEIVRIKTHCHALPD